MRYVLALLGLAMLVSCQVNPPIQGRQDPYCPPQVTFTDGDLAKQTAVGTPIPTRDAAGLLHVQVPIRADTDKTLFVDYRITFIGSNGQVVYQSSWLAKVLSPHVPDQINVNSLSAQAADFQMDLRFSR